MASIRILAALFGGISVALRAGGAALAVIIVMRSLTERFTPRRESGNIKKLVRYTEAFVAPVRTMLPSVVVKSNLDYSPLVTALMVLFLGFGAGVFFETVAELLVGLD